MKAMRVNDYARSSCFVALILFGIICCNCAISAPVKIVVAWGLGTNGETNVPGGLTDVVQVDAGFEYSVALKSNGTVVAWGTGVTLPPPTATNVVRISAGHSHCLALRKDGTVVGWGYSVWGQTSPPSTLTNVVAIAAGGNHSLALKNDGRVVGWGYDGDGAATPPTNLTSVVAIAAGEGHSLAVKQDGTVVAWGWNYYGQCNVPVGLNGVKSVAGNNYQSLALKNDGTFVQWGYGESNQVPPPTNSPVAAISQDALYSLALMSNATAVAWGNQTSYAVTRLPPGLTNVIAVAAGYEHALAIYLSNAPPRLELARSGDTVILYWPNSENGFVLESTENFLAAPVWSPVPNSPVVIGDQNVVGVLLSTGQRFFRLRSP